MLDRVIAARVFLETVERGSATAAAQALGMSRAMASRYLAAMEDWAGIRLLNRSTRHMSLTPAGENILPRCRALVSVSESITEISQAGQPPQGRLRVAMPAIFAATRFLHLLPEFRSEYPRIDLDLRVSDRPVDLVQDSIDVAIRISSGLDKAVIARKLGMVRSVLCASPTYLNQRGRPATPQDLGAYDCITYAQFGGHDWQLLNGDKAVRVSVNSVLRTDNSALLLSSARNHIGISMLPEFATLSTIKEGTLEVVLAGWAPQDLTLYALYASRDNLPSSVRALIDFLVEHVEDEGPALT